MCCANLIGPKETYKFWVIVYFPALQVLEEFFKNFLRSLEEFFRVLEEHLGLLETS